MKKLCHSLLLVLLTLGVYAQKTYYIVKISSAGKIFNTNHKLMKIGDALTDDQRLVFTSAKDLIIALNSTGTYEIAPKAKSTVPEWMTVLVKNNIRLQAENITLGSRTIGNQISLADYLSPRTINGEKINDQILVVGTFGIPLRDMGYGIVNNKENFFFLQLVDNYQNSTNNLLEVRNDTLLLKRNDFLFNGKLYSASENTLHLGFVKDYSGARNTQMIVPLHPVFMNNEELSHIVVGIKKAYPQASHNELVQQVYARLYYLYGHPDEQVIEKACN